MPGCQPCQCEKFQVPCRAHGSFDVSVVSCKPSDLQSCSGTQRFQAYKNEVYLFPKQPAALHVRWLSCWQASGGVYDVVRRGARWATVLRHRGLLKCKSRAQVARELPPSPQGTTASTTPPFRRVVCVINALVPQGTTASTTPPFRRVDCVINETWPRSRGVGPPRVIRHR